MVEDSELISRVREILSNCDLNTTSAGAVRRQLEADLGVDLSDRKKFISQLIDDIILNLEKQDEEEEVEVEDDDNNDDDDDDSKGTSSQRSLSPDAAPKKKRASGFTKLCSISPQLEEFFGVSEMARTEVVKQLWAYIRENDLQDPNDRRNIKCDDKLHSIFRVAKINMFQMNKALSKHIWPLETTNHECSVSSSSRPEKKQKRPKEEEDDTDEDNQKPKAKQSKGSTSGLLKPLQLSESFVKFLGTGETTLSRTEAVKRIWGYIKQNDLQDPSDKRRILCDEKLKELFEVDTFIGFSVAKYLKPHLIKAEQ